MFRLYRSLLTLAYLTMILLVTMVALAAWYADSLLSTILYAVVLYLVWFVCFILIEMFAQKRYNRFAETTLYQGRIGEFIRTNESFMRKRVARKRGVRNVLLINLGSGYHYSGDTDRAIATTYEVIPGKNLSKMNVLLQHLMYWNNMAIYLLEKGDCVGAADAKQRMSELLHTAKNPNNVQLDFFRSQILRLDLDLRMAGGDFEGVLPILEQDLFNATTPLGRLIVYYSIVRTHLHNGDTSKARECLYQMLAIGGDSYYISWAHEKLQELDVE